MKNQKSNGKRKKKGKKRKKMVNGYQLLVMGTARRNAIQSAVILNKTKCSGSPDALGRDPD